MEKQNSIHYAIDDTGNLVHIDSIEEGKTYYCPVCRGEFVAKRGNIRDHHFAHKGDICSWETYLHQVAKLKIAEWLKNAESIYLSIVSVCDKKKECVLAKNSCKGNSKVFDLKQYYQYAGIEMSFGNFQPDILLGKRSNLEKDPLFIEIFVTHGCSPEKIKSGYRIIEFEIESEEDIDKIIKSNSIAESGKVKIYNFNNPKCSDIKHELARYTIFTSGKAHWEQTNCTEIESSKRGICQIYFPIEASDFADMYQWALATAHEKGVAFKSCNLCEFSVYNDYYGDRVCKLYKTRQGNKMCRDNNPNECDKYCVGKYGRINNAISASIDSFPYVLKDNIRGITIKQIAKESNEDNP